MINTLKRSWSRFGLFLVLMAFWAFFIWRAEGFLTEYNLFTLVRFASVQIMIAFAQTLPVGRETAFGIVLIQSFVVSFGFILPTNAPQNMLCYGTGAFTIAQFAKVGVIVTIAGWLLITLLSATLWPMMGVL